MRGCSAGPVKQILVGLQRIGIVGLNHALQGAVETGWNDREKVVDYLLEYLAADNYIPNPRNEQFRTALWREFKRFRGEDIRHLYSSIDVTLQGEPGEDRDRFEAMLRHVFAEFELAPLIAYQLPLAGDRVPQLLIDGTSVIRGHVPLRRFKLTISKYISHW